MNNSNCYEDDRRATAYARLAFSGTYYLAFRDLPEIIMEHVHGKKTLDFGCGTGRSTRFLKALGFETIGIDIAEKMISKAKDLDPQGDYRLIDPVDLDQFTRHEFDLILAAFTFDNIPTVEEKLANLQAMKAALKDCGRIILLVSSPDIYTYEWLSFSTCDFPENLRARTAEQVKIIIRDIEDQRAVEDYLCFDEDYQSIFARADLDIIKAHRPLGQVDEPYDWVNEMIIAPWCIYVLAPKTF